MAAAKKRAGSRNYYDQACRYLLRLDTVPVLCWLTRLRQEQVSFQDWAVTSNVPWPGQPDRTCDTVARLLDQAKGGVPWLVVGEFQGEPDPDMFGRLLVYLGSLWLTLRPDGGRGDRYNIAAFVVNLTGKGMTSRHMGLGPDMQTILSIAECNLSEMSAENLLRRVKAGKAPRLALAWLPLMQGGQERKIIQRWLALARQEPDKEKRQALGLALLFAEKAGCREVWQDELKGWDVMESEVVKMWTEKATAKARTEGEARGEARGKAEFVAEVLEDRFGTLPARLRKAILAIVDAERLARLRQLAVQAKSIADFQKEADL